MAVIKLFCIVLLVLVAAGIYGLIQYFGAGFIIGFGVAFFLSEFGYYAITGQFFWLSGRY